MTGKDINKVQKVVKKAETETLTGAVKAWCKLFKSGKEINEILKENDIKVDRAIVPALVSLANDKETVIQLCKDILPRVDNTFCAYKEIERIYFDKQDQDKNTKLSEDKVAKMSIIGKAHKRFGYNEPVSYDGGIFYKPFDGVDKRVIRVAVPISRYTYNLIAKCITYYLTHPKNDR